MNMRERGDWVMRASPFFFVLLLNCGGRSSSSWTSAGPAECGLDTVWCGGQCVATQVASQVCPGGASAASSSSSGSNGWSGSGIGSSSGSPGSGNTPPLSGSSSGGVLAGDGGSSEASDAGASILPYTVVAAAYSRAVDDIVIVTDTGNALHLVDPHTLADVSIALPTAPASVAVSPDGTHAAVGHNGFISYVDLMAQTVTATWSVSAPFGAVALSNTYVYGVPSSDQWVSLYAVEASTGTVTESGQGFTWAGSQLAMSPDGQNLYLVEVGLSPESIYSYSLASPAQPTQTAMYFGDEEGPCGVMWISKDGSRLYTGCGYVFNASGLTYFGELTGVNDLVAGVDDWSADGTVAVLGAATAPSFESTTGATELELYAPEYLTLNQTITLPSIATPGGDAPSSGLYVFHDAAGTSTFAIVQATDPVSQVAVKGVVKLQ